MKQELEKLEQEFADLLGKLGERSNTKLKSKVFQFIEQEQQELDREMAELSDTEMSESSCQLSSADELAALEKEMRQLEQEVLGTRDRQEILDELIQSLERALQLLQELKQMRA